MRSSPISVEERFRNQFKQIHSSTYDKRLFDQQRMPDNDEDGDDVPTATTSASFEFSVDMSSPLNNNNDRTLSNFLRVNGHSNDRIIDPADDEDADDGTACTTRDTSLESADSQRKCTKRSASVPNSSSDCDGTSEGERSLSLPSKLAVPPFADSMMSGDSGFVQEHKDSRQSTPPNLHKSGHLDFEAPVDLASVLNPSDMSYQMFLNQLCRQQQQKNQVKSSEVPQSSTPAHKRSLVSSTTPERSSSDWKRRRSASPPRSHESPEDSTSGEKGTVESNATPMPSMILPPFLMTPFAALGAFQQQMLMGNAENGVLGQSPQAMAAFFNHFKNANLDVGRHETPTSTPQTHPHQLMNSLMMAASGGNSSDDDWESMMEVSNTDEAEKIRLMVGDKAAPVTDPNQCLMCRRVLSCKSALQMHYRTHTGERPFKCKICQRAFTTKGNLKTHMSVHKSKHSIHSTSPSMNGAVHPFLGLPSTSLTRSMMDRGDGPPCFLGLGQSQCPFCPKRFPAPPLLQQHLIQQHSGLLAPVGPRLFFPRSPLLGTPPTPQQLSAIAAAAGKPPLAALASVLGTPTFDPSVASSRNHVIAKRSTGSSSALLSSPQSYQPTPAAVESPAKRVAAEMSPSPVSSASSQRLNQFSMSALCSEKQKRPTASTAPAVVDSENGEGSSGELLESLKALMGDGQLPENALHQLLLSSLIKKESNSDVGPNGNGESAPNLFSPAAFFGGSALSGDAEERTVDSSTPHYVDDGFHEPKRLRAETSDDDRSSVRAPETAGSSLTSGALPSSLEAMEKMCAVAEPAPSPRPMAPLSKHQCGVCRKNFSSSSALQIHMRTHTGERPFKCEICSHTFTTRGNLKVHMGTHSYQPNPPRRGRRIFDYHVNGGAGSPVESEMSPPLLGLNGPAGFGQASPATPLGFPALLAAAVAASAAAASGSSAPPSLDALFNGAGGGLPPSLLAAALSAAAAPPPQPPAEDPLPASPLATCPICRMSFGTAAEMQTHFEAHIAVFAEVAATAKYDEADKSNGSAEVGRFGGAGDGGGADGVFA